jgi:NADPH2:quinone reductase
MTKTMKTMKGISVEQFGDSDVCKYKVDLAIPEPLENQVQIRVYAAGVNPVDCYIRSGTHSRQPTLPYTPGMDSAGVVSKVGDKVTKLKVGDRVFTVNSVSGTYAEYCVSNSMHTFKLNDKLSFEEGSALGIPYFTAYRALFLRANCKPGETVLIHGASGSVGIAAIQLAKAQGLIVIGTAGSQAGLDLVKAQGADHVFNHHQSDTYLNEIKSLFPDGLDIVLEMLANVNLDKDLSLLKWKRGRIVVIGNRGQVEINPRMLMAKETSIMGVTLFTSDEDDFNLMYAHLDALIKSDRLRPALGQMYKCQEANKAHHDVIVNSGANGRLTIQIE